MKTITFNEDKWVMVPKEPTPEMLERGSDEYIAPKISCTHSSRAIYKAMIAAAPKPNQE